MLVWIIQDGEPLPGIDPGVREWRCSILSKTLAARGHAVLWWASTFDHSQKRHRYKEPNTVDIISGVKIRLLHGPGYGSNKSLKRFIHQRSIARLFAQETVNHPVPDVIFCGMPLPELAEQAIIYGQKNHVPVVLDVRDQWPDLYLTMFPRILRGMAKLILKKEFRRIEWVCRYASAILSISETYLNWALNYAGRPRDRMDGVFALGYDASGDIVNETNINRLKDKYGIRSESIKVTFVGIFGFSYDLETVVNAAKVLQNRSEIDVQIVLVGDGDEGPRLRKMAQGLPNIVLTGWLDNESVQNILRLSSVCLVAYKEEATQSLPNKPFEYMSFGLPLIASLSGELEDLIKSEQIGLQYIAGDVDSLVEKISWFACNIEARQAMGQRARR